MRPAARSPFLKVPEAEWVCANGLCFAIFDSFPVSPGHVLVITRRWRPTPTELLHAGYLPLNRYEVIGRAWAISSAWACRT